MSISIGGSTLTFSDSTTMTTASVAGPPGPAGPVGSPSNVAGPPGPTGTPSSTYGAVGSYVVAYGGNNAACGVYAITNPGCTFSGSILQKRPGSCSNYGFVAMNISSGCTWGSSGASGAAYSYCPTNGSLGLSGTWRAMTFSRTKGASYPVNLFVRVS
jgi:hypothetical protein